MHSSGRGEDSPEPYRGVVLPSAQHQSQQPVQGPYGEQVRPAGGSPWGVPAGPPALQAQPQQQAPETADATQMLPPYPAGMPGTGPAGGPGPVPGQAAPAAPAGPAAAADATQMLPPYPAAGPAAAGPPQGPGGAPVPLAPPVPPVPPQAPGTPPAVHQPTAQPGPYQVPEAQQMPQTPQPGAQPGGPYIPQPAAEPPAGAADATQALPLSIFDEPKPYEQGYPQQQGYGQEYDDGHPQQQPGPQHDSDYDHLFRSDVPGPAPMRQRIIQPPAQQQHPGVPGRVPAGPPPYGQQNPPYGQQGYDNGYAYDEEPQGAGRRRLSPKVLIGIVVAGCVVAGLVVGGLLNSSGKASADNAGDKSPTPSAGASASASGTGGTTGGNGDSAAEQQAKALDSLLETSGNSRTSVVNAVESIRNCGDLSGAASALRAASGQRDGLITRLGSLSVDKLPNHGDLTAALTKAWRASAAADGHYANWAGQAQHDHKICKGGHARSTDETLAANRESGTATQQKKRAVRLWNAIARQYGLTQRQFSQL